MTFTPLQTVELLRTAELLDRQRSAEMLALNALAARGEAKTVTKTIKDLSRE
jgi:hypothetical protein